MLFKYFKGKFNFQGLFKSPVYSSPFQACTNPDSAMPSTFIKLPSVFKSFVLSIYGWVFKTGFTVIRVFL